MIEFDHVSKTYAAAGFAALHNVSFTVGAGELVVLIGTSGCGKTTALKLINRLVEPTAGRVLVDGQDVAQQEPVQLRRRIGYVIQQIGL
ncbi:MAG: ATP-binding cassette domain-containing protein, partial [Chloroflexi bacterium]|nr:ATP-binding cassette domain-containing protein [Chloroflexota bacterium]